MINVCTTTMTTRYFYNLDTANCEVFIDRGCNVEHSNNFNNYMTCMSTCRKCILFLISANMTLNLCLFL